MKTMNALVALLFTMAMTLFISVLFGLPLLAVAAVLLFVGLLPKPDGVANMALQKELWKSDIIELLFKDNEFAQSAVNADPFVTQGKIVHIPVAGAASTVSKNITSFPVNAVKRSDSEVLYSLDTYYSAPRHVEQIEKYELSYDKRQSVLGQDMRNLVEQAMNGLLFRWAPASAQTLRTLGSATPATISGGTGNRKAFTKQSFADVKLRMDRDNIPSSGRVCLLTADHFNQFLQSLSDAERVDVGRVANLATGVVGQYLGITIMMRSTVHRYRVVSTVLTPIDEQDAGFAGSTKTGDFAASLFWHRDQVERALGEVDIFDNHRQAEYYGDIYSMLLRMGGRIRRDIGVWAVVEDTSA